MFNSNASSAAGDANYIEDVFSTTQYIGNGSTQVITNGIDLAGKGGLVWTKNRNSGPNSHLLYDTIRGTGKYLSSDTSNAQITNATTLTSFNSDGFSLGVNASYNGSSTGYVSWAFRDQAKFFDVVTFTGNGTTQSIAHSLGSTPGFVIIKSSTQASDWRCFHRSTPTGYFFLNAADALETTSAANVYGNNSTTVAPTSTNITVGSSGAVNGSGQTFVAYVFAHDAGGFGLTGTDNVISCGSFTVSAGGTASVTLGFEPQWVLFKASSRVLDWSLQDTMRGMPVTAGISPKDLYPNLANAESNGNQAPPNATGFTWSGYANETFVYVAIRRGPMKVPTLATTVFEPATTANGTLLTSVPVRDALLNFALATPGWQMADRLRGILDGFPTNTSGAVTTNPFLVTNSTAAESTTNCRIGGLGISRSIATAGSWLNGDTGVIANGNFDTGYFFQRAPSFMDVVCDTGTGVGRTINHNLGVVPQLMIRKRRNSTSNWCVYPNDITQVLFWDATNAFGTNGATYWNSTTPTSTVFSIGTNSDVNTVGGTYVTYLFATCPNVSKVGTYTGTGTTQVINCGFTAGSRFIMIKRTDTSGDWYVWDSANGIVAGNDPYLLINSTAAQVTGTDYVDTAASGFELSSTAPAAINANGGSYIFLAIA